MIMDNSVKTRWYKDSFVYQIYPRSFCDSNGDGIGDIQGIISKLDYLKDLGITAVWLSPCYKSPNDDNGYDISNYRDIMDEFGTLDDFKEMVKGMHERNIKLVMDLVVNHTSDEHDWFKNSRISLDNPYRDYYIWRKGRGKNGKKPPNNWTSRFGGSAWEYDSTTKEWYLHLFTKKQPDLNWDNPKVRQEVRDICNYWFNLGVDGFRCDVITYISKKEGLPNGKFNLLARGDEHFTHGPNIHNYLTELNRESWSKYDTMIVGEAAGVTIDQALLYTAEERNEMDCVFQFEHAEANYWMHIFPLKFDLRKIQRVFSRWQFGLMQKGWNALYLENHDQARSIDTYAPGYGNKREQAAKMLAIAIFMQQGTPFVYQGEEIGMTNFPFKSFDECQDVVVQNIRKMLSPFDKLFEKTALKILRKRSRDNARTPMQWDLSENAGFSSGNPWIKVNPNFTEINVEKDKANPDSILNFYKKLISFRKGNDLIINGAFKENYVGSKDILCFERWFHGERLLVICNFKNKDVFFKSPMDAAYLESKLELHNYSYDRPVLQSLTLRPYEAMVYRLI